MTTQDVAAKFYEYMQQGAFDKIYAELFSEYATSEESPGSDWGKANGMNEIREKGKKWAETVEEMFGKAWRFQAEYLEMFGKSLEKIWSRQGLASARVCV